VYLQPWQTIRQAPQAWPRTSTEEQKPATKEDEMLHRRRRGGWLGIAGKPKPKLQRQWQWWGEETPAA
jgi:hypothetical protein